VNRRHGPRWLAGLDRAVGAIASAGMMLVLPVSLLLFLQWPLRDLVQAYSREANDLAQMLFALYVGMAITYATRQRAHLAADAFAHAYSPRARSWLARIAALFVLAPWSLFILYVAWPIVLQSVVQLEAFPETFNPGYFVVKLAVAVLGLLVFCQAIIDVFRRDGPDSD
jgi:TRAP-type mannitol/chloroaromatic compound transport system permease small subunit